MRSGSRHRATLAAESLLDGEAEKLTRKAIELALGGDLTALRLCLERILPARKERPVRVSLPEIKAAGDVVTATAALVSAVGAGEIAPGEAADLAMLISAAGRAIDLTEFEARLAALESRLSKEP
jgi:hypothetical protein